jgi:hypothetical protein
MANQPETSTTPPDAAPQSTSHAWRLALDPESERDQGRLRLVAAIVALCAGLWLAWVQGPWWVRLTGVASVLFSMRFAQKARAARAHQADARSHYLEITADQVTLAEGDKRRSVERARVLGVELDEDRLVVVLRLRGGEELPIEPRYGGLGLRELGEAIRRALCAA